MTYVRFEAALPNRQGRFAGVFGLVNGMARREQLTPAAWFKTTSVHLIERVPGYLAILDSHGVRWRRLESDDPGRVVYEDGDQVVVVPR